MQLSTLCSTAALALLVAFVAPRPAAADRPVGDVLVSKTAMPAAAASKAAYFAKLRKSGPTAFQEERESTKWKVHFAAFFKRPLNDLEVQVVVRETTPPPPPAPPVEPPPPPAAPPPVSETRHRLPSSDTSTLEAHVEIDSQRLEAGATYEVVVRDRSGVLARGRFVVTAAPGPR